MLLTEKEAGEKWCPMARVVENDGTMPTSFNRVQETQGTTVYTPPGSVCIGSRCMAWRGADIYSNEDGMRVHRGYCGAFGKV